MKNNARTSTATQAAKAAIDPPSPPPAPIDPLFLAAPQVATFVGTQPLTNASGFFFERDGRLYLVTSRHVLFDEGSDHRPDRIEIGLHVDATDLTQSTGFSVPLYDDGIAVWHQGSDHRPDRIEIGLHVDATDLTQSTGFSVPLYDDGIAVWHQGSDSGGEIDVAVIELDRTAFPAKAVVAAFTPAHIQTAFSAVPADTALRVVGFPLGFHDTVHYLPVLRHAAIASPFGIRFQRQGYFLTDARTHRGTSGAAVVMRDAQPSADTAALPWKLMGVHSSRMDMGNRDLVLDESLGLNCAWYADILLTLTAA